ncbi:Poly(A)-specific ribonuclease PNLDC1 [Araneus ventricosus]|uniref:Poly(A)-specific ribonuclease PNLDC1 n=1 Tax=Araneus ventricosus TaxID=182803 RepID=A0A4Y2MT32_ARAVE|nr:Poly(A)-specific ribonuclease PNLDC1 [Araneus ventricosus]
MVEVTRSNFSHLFPHVEKSIKDSTFIAIDAEFTGLNLGPSNDSNLFDSLAERYEKLRSRATSFIPCQIGLSTYTKDLDKNSYSVETFVFYVRPCMIGSIDRIFTCQASSLDFLCGFNFDFKKFLPEGIPYINENEEVQVRQELKDGSISLPHEKLQDPRYQVKVNEMIDKKFGKYTKYKPEISKERVTFPVDTKSHVYFQLREIRRKFPKLWASSQGDLIVVKMVSPRERKKLEKYEAAEQESVLDYFLGFTKVFRLLKNCQKPIVGHNLLMDLMLFYQNFHQNLPDSYDKFKKELHSVFPVIYDTKHIWLNIRQVLEFKRFVASSGLTTLYELFKK